MRLALLLPNWVGDAVMATPALRALRRHFAHDELVGIAPPGICALLEGHPSLDRLLPMRTKRSFPLARLRALTRLLREERFDLLVHFTNSLGSAAAGALARVPVRIGHVRRGRGPLLTRRLPAEAANGPPVPAIDHYLALAAALGAGPESPQMELATSAADEAAADRLWESFGTRRSRPTIALNNSGAFGAAKLWTEDGVTALAARILKDLDYNVLLLAGPAEADAAARIAAALPRPGILSTAAMPTLGLSKAAVRRSRLMVSTDSGPRHFAPAFGVPVVSLFGPTDPQRTALHTPLDRWVRLDLDCQPCQQRICPLGHHRCMRALEADRVWAAMTEQLERFPR
jgi:heptosyltransferase-2